MSCVDATLQTIPRWVQLNVGQHRTRASYEDIVKDQTPSTHNPVSTSSSGVRMIVAFLLFILCFPYESPAPVYGFFPGMSNILERADAVVVAEIVEQSGKSYFGGGDDFKIQIRKVLKG